MVLHATTFQRRSMHRFVGSGIIIANGINNTIGGTTTEAGNVISSNGDGIEIYADGSTGNVVQGNFIGTNATGSAALANIVAGVVIRSGASGNTLGGTASGAGNSIAFNNGPGVRIDSSIANAVLSNAIFSNDDKGIELSSSGNNLQSFPELILVASGSAETIIQGSLTSAPNTTYRLEFFSNADCDPSGFGEGQTFLGATLVTTDGTGNSPFKVGFAISVPSGYFVTATATDPSNNTSEFSRCIEVSTPTTNTPTGSDVEVTPVDPTTGTSPVTLIFDKVTAAGDTTLTTSGTGTPPPAGFKLGTPPTYYELHTTTTFEGEVTVCITYPATAYNNEANLKLFHREGDAWVDVTTEVDTTNNVICGRVTSFSEFAVFEPQYELRGFYSPVDMSIKNSVKGGATVPLKFEVFHTTTELTDVAIVKPITQQQISCPTGTADAIEETVTGTTSLRYDTSAGQFIYNWQTPKKPGTCYRVKVTTNDGSALEADFELK